MDFSYIVCMIFCILFIIARFLDFTDLYCLDIIRLLIKELFKPCKSPCPSQEQDKVSKVSTYYSYKNKLFPLKKQISYTANTDDKRQI